MDEFSLSGESFYKRVQFLPVLKLLKLWLQSLNTDNEKDKFLKSLWTARLAWVHQEILTNNVEELQSQCLDNWKIAIATYKAHMDQTNIEHKRILSMMLAESAHAQIGYWQYEACEGAIDEAL